MLCLQNATIKTLDSFDPLVFTSPFTDEEMPGEISEPAR